MAQETLRLCRAPMRRATRTAVGALVVVVTVGSGSAAASAVSPGFSTRSSRIAVSSTEPGFAARLRKTTLASPLRDPMQLAVAPDGRVFYVERAGRLQVYEPDSGRTRQLASLDVPTTGEHGLLGLALDPHFLANGW